MEEPFQKGNPLTEAGKGGLQPVNRRFITMYLLISLYGVILTMLLDSSISASLIMVLGGYPYQAGSVDSLINLGIVVSAVLSAILLSKFRYYKHMFLLFSLCSLLSLACLALTLSMGTNKTVIYVILLTVFLYYFFTGSLSLPIYELLNLFVDSRSRVVVMSNCLAIGQLCTLLISVAVGWLLNQQSGGSIDSYRLIFIFSVFVSFLHLITLLWLDQVKVSRGASQERIAFFTFYKEQLHLLRMLPSLRLFIAAVILYAVCWSATGLYIGLGFKENAARMDEILASGIFIRTLVKASCYYACGQLAKRYGNKAILIAIGVTGLCTPLTSLFLPVDYFIIILVTTNIAPMAYVYFLNDLFERSDETTFKSQFTMFTLASVPAALIIPVLGLLIGQQPQIFSAVMLLIQLGGIYLVTRLGKGGVT
ncbi:MFS transporter [Paenibacillus silviterrae]|uniref:MFS transporter n=1 Tax=Paenibacillus silviterrae TaxID=3242194 RepID=UPI002543CFFA|nr:MFS transporter [Paenibacillus chinjuensis]